MYNNSSLIKGMWYTNQYCHLIHPTVINALSNFDAIIFTNHYDGEAHGDFDGQKILADNNPFIKLAIFSRILGATGHTRCEIAFASSTSISHTTPRDAEDKHFIYR